MYKEFNAHPKGIKTTDCVVRAISTAFNKDYMECTKTPSSYTNILKASQD